MWGAGRRGMTERRRQPASCGRRGTGSILAAALTLGLGWSGAAPVVVAADGADPFWSGAWSFDRERPGGPPPGFTASVLGGGPAGVWKIEADPRAPGAPNVLLQADACPAPDCWRVLLLDEREFDHLDLGVLIRLVSGGPESGAGLVLSARDAQNFCAVVVDRAMETLEVVRVRDGQRTVLDRQALKKSKKTWHGLRVQRINTRKLNKPYLEIAFDGELVLDVSDEGLTVGKIGVLTRGDAVVAFDTLRVMQLFSNAPLSKPPAY